MTIQLMMVDVIIIIIISLLSNNKFYLRSNVYRHIWCMKLLIIFKDILSNNVVVEWVRVDMEEGGAQVESSRLK